MANRWTVLLAGFPAFWPVFFAELANGLATAFNGLSVSLDGLDVFTDKREFQDTIELVFVLERRRRRRVGKNDAMLRTFRVVDDWHRWLVEERPRLESAQLDSAELDDIPF